MEDLVIEIKDGTVFIKGIPDEDHEGTVYAVINRSELPITRAGGTSEWVEHLQEKTWVNRELLYRIAQTIESEFPDNVIDWYKTFYQVEKQIYLESIKEVLTKKKHKLVDQLFDEIKFNKDQSDQVTHDIVHTSVLQGLKDYGLR